MDEQGSEFTGYFRTTCRESLVNFSRTKKQIMRRLIMSLADSMQFLTREIVPEMEKKINMRQRGNILSKCLG